jgi:hypothetical protein
MANGNRPIGISILGILMILGGLGFIFLGLLVIALGAGGSALLGPPFSSLGSLAKLGSALGVIVIVVGLVDLATGYGFMKGGMRWSWWVAVVLYILGMVLGIATLLVSIGIIYIIVEGLLLYYITRPGVKSWFGL